MTEPTPTSEYEGSDVSESEILPQDDSVPAGDDIEYTENTSDVEPHELPEIVPSVSLPVVLDRPVQTVGRRKEAVCRIRLIPGNGTITLNGRTLDNYFPNKVHQQLIKEPLVNLEKAETYDVIARLHGGGVTGQAGALRLAIARALIEVDENDRPALKKAGFLTRDARATERKKYGLKKARKAPQYSKR
ncbi:small subunit ribosomal protein S9 [Nakamurella flavida]|nr:small subunit ribosomal protein S9 [Nakamurella flavida]